MNLVKPVLCVDIGGTSTKLGVFVGRKEVKIERAFPTAGPARRFADDICDAIEQLIAANSWSWNQVEGVGVAVAGFLDDGRSRMIYNSNLPWLERYPLRDHLQARIDCPVALEIDSNTAALAEQRLGCGQESRRFLCVTIGTGYGVGMIVNGEPLRFAYGCMGDAGHMVIQRDGPLCGCGGRGCAEVFVSAPLLANQYKQRASRQEAISLRHVIEAAQTEDAIAQGILSQAGTWLGISLATLANTFYPDRIAIAGGLAEAGDLVMGAVHRSFRQSTSTFAFEQTTLQRAQLGALATLTGAAFAVLPPSAVNALS